jgi:copper chaperone CopZ
VVVERIEGVREAEFSWQEERGVVTYDTARTSIEAVVEELHRMTDYQARVTEGR